MNGGLRQLLRRDGAIAAALVLALTAVYSANGGVLAGNDPTPNIYLAANVIGEGRLSFAPSRDPGLFLWSLPTDAAPRYLTSLTALVDGRPAEALYADGLLEPEPGYYIILSVKSDARTGEPTYVGLYGPGAGLSAVPVLALIRAFVGDLRQAPEALWYGAKLVASLFAAASAAFVYLTCRRWLERMPSLALTLAYGLGTCVWSMSSQALWQHAPNELFLALGTWLFVRDRPRDVALAGLSFSLAAACRPTSAMFAAAIAVYLLIVNRRAALVFLATSAVVALALGAYNLHFLGSPLRLGQAAVEAERSWSTPLLEGLAGVLVSPSRGLFVFTPFLILSVGGAIAVWRRPEYARLRPLTIAVLAVLLLHSKWREWWGGWSYGYRIVVDLVPALVVFLVPVVGWLRATRTRLAAASVLVAWSVLVQVIGAFIYDVDGWNARAVHTLALPSGYTVVPDERAFEAAIRSGIVPGPDVAQSIEDPRWRGRLWSLRDNQLGYYLMHLSQARQRRAALSDAWLARWRAPAGDPGH